MTVSPPALPRRTPQATLTRASAAAVERRNTTAGAARTREALEARDALAAALRQAGIQLPAMDVRTPWADVVHAHEPGTATGHGEERESGRRGEVRYALVHLGVCSAPVALALAAVIEKGTRR
ncbi:hypothetical protein PZB75_25485 [Streptomyces sp. AM 4-1-1]|uniref:hypothetical protein n=1 Tax=Streptomyces sp. AM 4-1-1 TaxID=3028710 RepID=UPI0023BA12B4|nr:hypothetical protein [Streptomyces sp. AM 4-1-1]WEH36413.1 hypothetical protein PZB75_25485 [Streptomyces sp. AM 4-1-1]